MTDPKQVKKAIMTETKIMSSIEKILDKIVDPKMQMRIALWVYQKYVADKQPIAPPVQISSAWPDKQYPYPPRKEYPIPGGVAAYAASPLSPPWEGSEENVKWTITCGGTEAPKTTCCGGECKCKTGDKEE